LDGAAIASESGKDGAAIASESGKDGAAIATPENGKQRKTSHTPESYSGKVRKSTRSFSVANFNNQVNSKFYFVCVCKTSAGQNEH